MCVRLIGKIEIIAHQIEPVVVRMNSRREGFGHLEV
jgi:hypothetical protein